MAPPLGVLRRLSQVCHPAGKEASTGHDADSAKAWRVCATCTENGLVRTSSEIPLPSPSFYSSSGLGTVANWTSALAFQWELRPHPASCVKHGRLAGCATLWGGSSYPTQSSVPRDNDQLGSLAGAARLLQDNAGVLKHCSDGTELSHGGAGQRCC